MKKIVSVVMISAVVGLHIGGSLQSVGIYSIDSSRLMQGSKEGKQLIEEFKKDQEGAVKKLKDLDKELTSARETLEKQATLLSKEALREKQQELAKKEKSAERTRQELGEDLNLKYQSKQEALFAKHLQIAQKIFEGKSKGEGLLVDVRTPGVLAVGKNTNITDEVLKSVDADYAASLKKTTKAA